MSFFSKIKEGLTKTRRALGGIFDGFGGEDFYDELEENLILTDLGAEASINAVEQLREKVREKKIRDSEEVREELRQIILEMMNVGDTAIKTGTKPSVILVIGVNGVGKTTTIGKLACMYHDQGKKVLLCAGDTFRAAASEQLTIWAERSGAEIVSQGEGADPASVVYDSIQAAKARGADIIICDTAGRLHNKQNLMNELEKMQRIVNRELPDADRETILVMDATTGQNGLIQAKEFSAVTNVTGIALTKLDGTAKGGIVVAVANQLKIPVKLVGVGEGKDDLMMFNPDDFTKALLEN